MADNYLFENWRSVLGTASRDELQIARVLNGVVSITNGYLLIRTPMDLPDGFYTLSGRANELLPATTARWFSFPDVEACRPNFVTLAASPPIPKGVVREMIDFAEHARRMADGYIKYVSVASTGLSAPPDLQFNLPLGSGLLEPAHVECLYLKQALTEMMRYDEIRIARENVPESPLFFGRSWSECALLRGTNSCHNLRRY